METKPARERKFETLFDGDEIEGTFYALGDGVTGIDASIAHYLVTTGRLAEIGDDEFAQLPNVAAGNDTETDEQRTARALAEADAEADAAFLEAAHADYAAGNIPVDLVNPDAAQDADDRLIGKAELIELAKASGAIIKGSFTKAELAQAIMAVRIKDQSAQG